ncbi:hypothetical protein FHR83_003059 [Actinoplanes campanulatus]|uniref:Uncharacterized protein n=1 Tax=Actinoplanes campanulatus TaxID=113559 RepID=A0A7W5FEG9_9ACTN|nr:hypothetical protein [Actinoplanes campanulatus]MBB3095396.1 hypothetical protein [Actinoplanes campanulatus]GGN41890.1 hypothetical protein GCM10010109_72420 [Actinoplanes campanulatus]GID35000.1 hypothetical protein Aca09nite_15060 [Actinoplanes campanulatus]
MSTIAMFVFSLVQAALLLAVVLLGIAARRQRELADRQAEHGGSVFITDEVDVAAADVELATAAAQRALDEADQAHDRALWASTTRDIAELRHRQVLRQAEAAGRTHQLVQRAALNAYQRGQLSVGELNLIWRHAHTTAESTQTPAAVPLGWELRVLESRRRYEQAAAAAAQAEEEAQQTAATAAALADDMRAAELRLSAAQRSANIGLVGLLRATWADPVTR